jgi:hypothetical protein
MRLELEMKRHLDALLVLAKENASYFRWRNAVLLAQRDP